MTDRGSIPVRDRAANPEGNRDYKQMRDRTSVPVNRRTSTRMRDRAFLIAVACVGLPAVLVLAQNIRESAAPLYGPPTVDKQVVMAKVEAGQLSFKEARFYMREEDRDGPPGDAAQQARGQTAGEEAAGASSTGEGQDTGLAATGAPGQEGGAAGKTGDAPVGESREESP